MSPLRILVTGHLGYVGSVLIPYLRARHPAADLIGFDPGYFAASLTGSVTLPETALTRQFFGDVRDLPEGLLHGVDAVVHLAAISNDPMGEDFMEVTRDVNHRASVRLAHLAARAGVRDFVFASSCSVYGAADGPPRTETDPTHPLTVYARSKVAVEDDLRHADLLGMRFTSLRFATACGMSDRLRLDLVLNDFVASALTTGVITVLSDGTPWRPLIDVRDMARAIDWAITRPAHHGAALALNVGRHDHNHQIRDLAHAVAARIPGTRVSIAADAPPDRRSYQVSFDAFARIAPEAVPRHSLTDSIDALVLGLQRMGFADPDFRRSPLMRLIALRAHVAGQRLDPTLRWRRAA